MMTTLRRLVVFYLFALLVCGVAYPGAITGVAQNFFRDKAEGSAISLGQLQLASTLIGQSVVQPTYFFGRPSATPAFESNALQSAASQDAVASASVKAKIADRVAKLQALDQTNAHHFPADLVLASGSGLDPDISVPAALYQIPRIARLREKSEAEIKTLVDRFTTDRQFGLLGEPRVNVNLLNLALDGRI